MVVYSCKTFGEIIYITRGKAWYKLFLVCLMGICWFFAIGHRLIFCNIPCLFSKTSTCCKGTKDGNSSPYSCCLIIVLQCLHRKFLQSGCARKQVTWLDHRKILNVLYHKEHRSSCDTLFLIYCKNITNLLSWVLWTYLATPIKNNNFIL